MEELDLHRIRRVHLLGIGGIGMSALARYFLHRGIVVSGYDRIRSEMTDALEKEGIPVVFEDDPAAIPKLFLEEERERKLAVRSLAIGAENEQRSFLEKEGVPMGTRPKVLARIAEGYDCIAVAGTHGKTTTACMIAFLLRECGIPCHALLGGISADFASNVLLEGEVERLVVEADEYGRSFLELEPRIAVVTAVESDHLDVYGDRESLTEAFKEFQGRVAADGMLFLGEGVPLADALEVPVRYFGEGEGEGIRVKGIRVEDGEYRFDLHFGDEVWEGLVSRMPGTHNIIDLAAAIGVLREFGAEEGAVRRALPSFKGVRRRFELRFRSKGRALIDDYAHHPTELRATVRTARELYPDRRILGVFQPHLYSRTRDQADAFAEALSGLDELILLPIYPAREEPIPGVRSEMILEKVQLSKKHLVEKEELIPFLRERDPEILLMLGAGDIAGKVGEAAELMEEMAENDSSE